MSKIDYIRIELYHQAMALPGKFKRIAIVGISPVMHAVQARLEQMFPKRILVSSHGSLVDCRGRDYTRWNDVFFAVHHDAAVHPYNNSWLTKLARQNKLSNQAIGLISTPINVQLPDDLKNILYEFMLNERSSLINGYHPIRYQPESCNSPKFTNEDDLKVAIAAIKSAMSE